jgi:signal transduction histidine kinase
MSYKYKFTSVDLFILTLLFSLISIETTFSQNSVRDSLELKIIEFRTEPHYESTKEYIDLLTNLGSEISPYKMDSLLILVNEVIALSKKINYVKGEVDGLLNLGIYYSDTGNQDLAVETFLSARSKAKELNDNDLILRLTNQIALEYMFKEDYTKSLKEFIDGIKSAKKNNSLLLLSTFYLNKAELHIVLKEYNQAIVLLKTANKNNLKLNDDELTAKTLANLTSAYIETGDISSAAANIDRCISIFKNLKSTDWLTYTYELKASIAQAQNEYTEALVWLKKSEKLNEGIDQIRYKIPLNYSLAKTYFELKDYSKAELYALKGLEMCESLNVLEKRDEILKLLYNLKKGANDPVNALLYFERFKNVSDTINKHQNEKQFRLLNSNHEFEQEKERYLIENEKKVTKQKNMFYFALLTSLAFLYIIFLLYRNNKIQSELNQKLIVRTTELQKSNKTQKKLFSIIAHDLKGPINSFKSMLNLSQEGEISTRDFKMLLPVLGGQLDDLSFTLNNLLHWGQTQIDNSFTNPEPSNLRPVITENIAFLSKTADKKLIQLKNEIEFDVMTWSDENQIAVIVRNLISNAIKFTPTNGTITIGAIEKPNEWEIWVEDNGVGIDEDTLDLIFNKRLSISTYGTNNETGTGLGLSLCQEMIQKNGGRIWAESTPQKGTCFFFTVPKYKYAS